MPASVNWRLVRRPGCRPRCSHFTHYGEAHNWITEPAKRQSRYARLCGCARSCQRWREPWIVSSVLLVGPTLNARQGTGAPRRSVPDGPAPRTRRTVSLPV